MAQSNHHRPASSAGDEERLACRTCRSARQPPPDLSTFAGHGVGATRLPVNATDESRIVGTRVCVMRARP